MPIWNWIVVLGVTAVKVEVVIGQHPGSFSTQAQPGEIQSFVTSFF